MLVLSLNNAVSFLLIAPVLKIVQHQRITRLGGPIISHSWEKSFSLFRDEITGVIGCDFLKRPTYSSVFGNSNVVSPNICNIFGLLSALITRSDVTVESLPPEKETNISFTSYSVDTSLI